MGLAIYQVDAFTDKAFAGNPAAVCILPEPADESWMQSVAAEMNLSETAFLVKQDDGYNLRWFTPAVEVELCGHATLASAHTLYELGLVPGEAEAHFHTQSGLLTAKKNGAWIELNFPLIPQEPANPPSRLAEALGAEPVYTGRSRHDYIVEVDSEDTVRGLNPNIHLLREIDVRGIIVTSAASSPGFDFVSRFFAPGAGIDEDPVTGSAHCCLGPYWQHQLDKNDFIAYQASKRGGTVRVSVDGNRVRLRGQAVTVMRAELVDS
jgi:PhzF family phenazine biosynthesis protein